jgi:hypothetical protein
MDNATTQALVVSFLALGQACGDETLNRATRLIDSLLGKGAYDPEAEKVLAGLVAAMRPEREPGAITK